MAQWLEAMTPRVGISFDLFNTLVEIDQDVPTIAQELTDRGYPCSACVEEIWNSHGFDGQKTSNPGEMSYKEWRRNSLGALCELCGVPTNSCASLVDELIELDQRWTVKPRIGAVSLISRLFSRRIPVCILSNWDYPIEPYLRMAGLPSDLKSVTSAQIGIRKPHPGTFAAARDLLEIEPKYHIHVGDSWRSDVTGAIRSGAWAIWVSKKSIPNLPSRIRSTSIEELPETLERIVIELSRHAK